MVDLVKLFESTMVKRKKNPDRQFDLKYRSIKDVQTIKIIGKSKKSFPQNLHKRELLKGFEDSLSFSGELQIQLGVASSFLVE